MSVHAMPVKERLSKSRVLMGASAAAIGWAVSTAALALPVNPTIFANSPYVGTAATFTPGTGTLTVTQNADRVVIDWDSFNIDPGETVTFVQGADNFIAFNRIDPGQFTTIDGQLFGNGSVWLFSPGGILFGSNAQVSVGSFFAGLGQLDDFQANEAMGLADASVYVGYLPAVNTNTLTVDAGASITATDFLILQGAQIDMGGDLVSTGGVAFMSAEGAVVDFNATSPTGVTLTNLGLSWDPAGRGTPYFNHTGTTTAAWVDLSYGQLFQASYQEIINLDGVITATAATSGLTNRPANTAIWVGGLNSVTGLTGGRTVLLNVLGDINATAGEINLQATDIFFALGSTVDAGTAFRTFTYGDITIQGDISAGGQTTIHSQAENATIRIESTGSVETTAGNIDISGNRDYALVEIFGEVTGANLVNIRSKGDVYIGSTAVVTGNADDSGGNYFGITVQSGLGFDFNTQTMTAIGAGDITVASGALLDASAVNNPHRVWLGANYGGVEMAGTVYGSRVSVGGTEDILISGDIVGTDLVQIIGADGDIPLAGGGDITITGSITANDLVTLWAPYGDVLIESGAQITSDADSTPTTDVFGISTNEDRIYVYSGGSITIESGATLVTGTIGDPTSSIIFDAEGADEVGFTSAAIDISGELHAQDIDITSHGGSIRVRDGAALYSDDHFVLEAEGYVVLEAGSLITSGLDPAQPRNPLDFPFAGIADNVDFAINAQDVAIYGDVVADRVVIIADTAYGYAYVGGAGRGANVDGYDLGDAFFLSDAEFQNIQATTIMIISGSDGAEGVTDFNSDLEIQDLTIGGSVETVFFGASGDNVIYVTGEIQVSQPGAVDLWIGGAIPSHGDLFLPASFIPGNIVITGSIGTEANPFGQVSLVALGDIGMGSEDFIAAAAGDPNFSALLSSDDFAIDEGHIFIAADGLSIASNGRIIQQNTAPTGEFAGLLIGEPTQASPLIGSPDTLEGVQIGGASPFTISFASGPTRVELFGSFVTQSGTAGGPDAAETDFLAEDDVGDNSNLYFNSCRFGGGSCGGTSDAPQFETPTDMSVDDIEPMDEAAADDTGEDTTDEEESAEDQADSEDQDSELFRSLVAPGSDRAYEQERIGEPITGSGNEDLWTGRGDGARP